MAGNPGRGGGTDTGAQAECHGGEALQTKAARPAAGTSRADRSVGVGAGGP